MLAFHAAPPSGEWINDPNALVYADGAYRLFVQHRGDGPRFRATGWARFSSSDLVRWTFDGVVLPPQGEEWMYSGSVTAKDHELTAFHTLHRAGREQQVVRRSADAGATWSPVEKIASLGGPMPNRRDPFILPFGDEWRLLLAEPCDWTDGKSQPPSQLAVFRSIDQRSWSRCGTIGPWSDRGIMWEVPVLTRIDGADVLFLSLVDRRSGGAECSVQAWIGSFDGASFNLSAGAPASGQRVDFGPDFYALMRSADGGWPLSGPVFVAWASNWSSARSMRWPGFEGGPVSLPRTIGLSRADGIPNLRVAPADPLLAAFRSSCADAPRSGVGKIAIAGELPFRIVVQGREALATIEGQPMSGSLSVRRRGEGSLDWAQTYAGVIKPHADRTIDAFVDGPLVELFLNEEGKSVSLALGGGVEDGPLSFEAWAGDMPVSIRWAAYAE